MGVRIVGMNLHREREARVDEFGQQRKYLRGVEASDKPRSETCAQLRDGLARVLAGGNAIVVPLAVTFIKAYMQTRD